MSFLKLLRPELLFMIVWITTLGFIHLELTSNIPSVSYEVFIPIYFSLLLCLFLIIINFSRSPSSSKMVESLRLKVITDLSKLKKFHKLTFNLFLILMIIDFLYSLGFPLLWLLTGIDKDYSNPGIPTIRGLQYTLFLMALSSLGIVRSVDPTYRKILVCIIVLFPLLMLARGLFTYAIIQYLLSRNILGRIHFKNLIKVLIFFIVYIMIFGFVGDIRQGISNPFSYLVNPDKGLILQYLPNGFTWLYIYLTSGYANIMTTFDYMTPTFSPVSIIYNLIPGALKVLFQIKDDGGELITDASLNVASYFAGYMAAYGLLGGVFGGIILILTSLKWYRSIDKYGPFSIIGYSACACAIILSPFFDALLTVSTISQLIIIYLAVKNIKFL